MPSGFEQDFTSQLRAFAKKVNDRMDAVVGNAALEFTSRVINRTPVDTGRAKANWQVSLDSPATAAVRGVDKDGVTTLAAAASVLERSKYLTTVYVTNNVEYIVGLEYGKSKQAPAGMVRVTVSEWAEIVAHAVEMTNKSGGVI